MMYRPRAWRIARFMPEGTKRPELCSRRIEGCAAAFASTTSREASSDSPSATRISYCSSGNPLASRLARQLAIYFCSLRMGMMMDTSRISPAVCSGRLDCIVLISPMVAADGGRPSGARSSALVSRRRLGLGPVFQPLRGYAPHDRVGRDGGGTHGAGRENRAIVDGDAREDEAAGADPHIVADAHRG